MRVDWRIAPKHKADYLNELEVIKQRPLGASSPSRNSNNTPT